MFVASAAAASGTSYPRVQVHAGRNTQSAHRRAAPERRQRRLRGQCRRSTSRCAPARSIDHCRLQNCADAASVLRHAGRARRRTAPTYRLRTVTLGGLASRSTIFVKLAGRAARCELTAASIANGIQTHDVFAEIEHAGADTVTREMYPRHRHRARQARLQRQDDRARDRRTAPIPTSR